MGRSQSHEKCQKKKKKLKCSRHFCKDVGIGQGDNEAVSRLMNNAICLSNDAVLLGKISLKSPASHVEGSVWPGHLDSLILACFGESTAPSQHNSLLMDSLPFSQKVKSFLNIMMSPFLKSVTGISG